MSAEYDENRFQSRKGREILNGQGSFKTVTQAILSLCLRIGALDDVLDCICPLHRRGDHC